MKTKKAVEYATTLESATTEIKKVKMSKIADTISNTMALTPVFAMKAHAIMNNMEAPYWVFVLIAMLPAFYLSDLIVTQMATSELNNDKGRFWISALSFVLSWSSLSDQMFRSVTSFADAFTVQNAMTFIIITVISGAPIIIIQFSVKAWKKKLTIMTKEGAIYAPDVVNSELVSEAVKQHIEEAKKSMKTTSLGKLGRLGKQFARNARKASAYNQETKGTKKVEDFIAA